MATKQTKKAAPKAAVKVNPVPALKATLKAHKSDLTVATRNYNSSGKAIERLTKKIATLEARIAKLTPGK